MQTKKRCVVGDKSGESDHSTLEQEKVQIGHIGTGGGGGTDPDTLEQEKVEEVELQIRAQWNRRRWSDRSKWLVGKSLGQCRWGV